MDKIFIEVRAGEGGKDSKLFINDMAKMYMSYGKKIGMKMECL